jgi:hypothetical protein
MLSLLRIEYGYVTPCGERLKFNDQYGVLRMSSDTPYSVH